VSYHSTRPNGSKLLVDNQLQVTFALVYLCLVSKGFITPGEALLLSTFNGPSNQVQHLRLETDTLQYKMQANDVTLAPEVALIPFVCVCNCLPVVSGKLLKGNLLCRVGRHPNFHLPARRPCPAYTNV
jgi:hypothetical protein